MPYLLFMNKQLNLKLSSPANYRWRFIGQIIWREHKPLVHCTYCMQCMQTRYDALYQGVMEVYPKSDFAKRLNYIGSISFYIVIQCLVYILISAHNSRPSHIDEQQRPGRVCAYANTRLSTRCLHT